MNAANYFKDQKRPSSRLSTVMFRGTPGVESVNISLFILYFFLYRDKNYN